MTTAKIVFVVTSSRHLGTTGDPTGVWMEELTTPYYIFHDAGYQIDIASIQGGDIPIDPRSYKEQGENPPSVDRFLKDPQAMAALQTSLPIDSIASENYAALFLPGGHGTMFDLPDNHALADRIATMLTRGAIVAAVCHGPAGLVSAKFEDGTPVVSGKKVAAFTNAEEQAVGLTDAMPFLLETRLRDLKADVHTAPNFEPHALADGTLITGQNPASSQAVADLVIEALKRFTATPS